MRKNTVKPLHVTVYSPLLGGFYFGELIGQIRTVCLIKGYSLTVIETKGYGKYNSPLATESCDVAILLRNAVDVNFVERLQKEGKAVVSIACDFFPLQVPVVGCDNENGAAQAFDYLYKKGHKNMAFIGELGQFDVRKRYEAFCDSNEKAGFELSESQILSVDDSLTSGGIHAAEQFLKSHNESTAIVFGACLTAIGFIKKMEKLDPQRLSELDVVSFDAFSVVPFCTNDIAIVDQNLHIIAHTAIVLAEQVRAGKPVEHTTYVQPKLIRADSELLKGDQVFLATSMELDEFYDANYMKSVVANMHEWPQSIARSRLDDIMMMEPLFSSFLRVAVFSKVTAVEAHTPQLKILKVVVSDRYTTARESLAGECVAAAQIHSVVEEFVGESFGRALHIPIVRNNTMLAVLSVFGKAQTGGRRASFLAMCSYLNIIADALLNEFTKKATPDKPVETPKTSEVGEVGIIRWDKNELETRWDDTSLAMLDLNTDLERTVYRNMEITDRVNENDASAARALMQNPEHAGGRVYLRMRLKDKSYATFELRHHAEIDKNISEYALSFWEADV